ncbi:MAG: hypothetical protein HRU12_03060, partial [Phaeodactylibacter sp.]|nr:hypothetical protein [Phaeodactylibacter sp.]
LAFSPQIGYWYFVSGQLYFNPYQGEGFNFLQPNIYKGWFDFSNGWLIYTPVMIFSLAGLFFLPRNAPGRLLPIIVFIGLHAYIHYSYYAWTYFPGLGSRPMVETYPLLAFGLGACFITLAQKRWSNIGLIAVLVLFSWLNLFQTWQMKKGVIWSERGNAAFYMETFGTLQPSWQSMVAFDTKERQPKDTSMLQPAEVLFLESFERLDFPNRTTDLAYQGAAAFVPPAQEFFFAQQLSLKGAQAGDWLRISLHTFMNEADQIWNRDHSIILFAELRNEKDRRKKRRLMSPTSYVGNTDYSIWHAGTPEQWGEATFFMRLPNSFTADWYLRLYLRNPAGQQVFLDDIKVQRYQ